MKEKPYNLLLVTGLIFLLTSFFVLRQDNSVDIHLHDTYFVIAHTHFSRWLEILSLFVWTLYLLTHKMLYSNALTWTHVVITLLTLLLFALPLFFDDSFMNPPPRRYHDYRDWKSFDHYTRIIKAISITIFILLFGQFIFVINLIAGIFKRRT